MVWRQALAILLRVARSIEEGQIEVALFSNRFT
jgi:hypothetical protein